MVDLNADKAVIGVVKETAEDEAKEIEIKVKMMLT